MIGEKLVCISSGEWKVESRWWLKRVLGIMAKVNGPKNGETVHVSHILFNPENGLFGFELVEYPELLYYEHNFQLHSDLQDVLTDIQNQMNHA